MLDMRTLRLAAAVMAVAAVSALTVPLSTAAAAPATVSCTAWSRSQVASGYGTLENMAFDGRGGLLLSELSFTGPGALRKLTAQGARSTEVADVDGPGGIVVSGDGAFFNTGNTTAAGLFDTPDGTVELLALDTGETRTVARGLTMPNGLAVLPGGELVVSRDLGSDTGLTRIDPVTGRGEPFAPAVTSTNGLVWDSGRELLWVATSFNSATEIVGVDVATGTPSRTLTIPGPGLLNVADDLTLGPDGNLYVALNVAGKIVRLDPDGGGSCVIADGLPLTSAVEFGAGPGWDEKSLYATSFLGTVTRVSPAAR